MQQQVGQVEGRWIQPGQAQLENKCQYPQRPEVVWREGEGLEQGREPLLCEAVERQVLQEDVVVPYEIKVDRRQVDQQDNQGRQQDRPGFTGEILQARIGWNGINSPDDFNKAAARLACSLDRQTWLQNLSRQEALAGF